MTSIVIVNYNGGRWVVENLRVLAERLPPGIAEVIVVDNASSDGSADAIRRELPEVRLLRADENRGYAAGVNAGLAEAVGDVLVVMNPDVVPEPGALEHLCTCVRKRTEFAILGGAVLSEDGKIGSSCFRALPRPNDVLREGFLFRHRTVPSRDALAEAKVEVVPTEVVSGSIMALRRETFRELGPMDENFFLYREDVEWCRRAADGGMNVGVVPGARFAHEGGASTGAAEGPAFAARVLADFHYFEKTGRAGPSRVRRMWMLVLWFRTNLYRADSYLGILGTRARSRRRAAAYGIVHRRLKLFSWSRVDGQNCHPGRLGSIPVARPRREGDERPRVLFVIPDMDFGGSQRRVEYLVNGPLAERFDFEILCLRDAGDIGGRLKARVPVWEVGIDGWRRPATWRRVREYCELLSPDLLHSSTFPGDIGAWVGFRGRVPWVSAKVSIDTWMSAPVRFLERLILRRADRVYAVADEVAEAKSFLARGGRLPAVVPNPPMIPFAEGKPRRLPEGAPVRLMCIGRLERVKRVGDFLSTAAILHRSHPGRFSFSIVGDGSLSDELRTQASELGLSDVAEFRGAVSDVVPEFDAADIVALFSEGEGSPNTVLETIARGRIPLARRAAGTVGSVPRVLDRCLVDSESPEAFAERVLDMVENPDEYLSLVDLAREALVRRRGSFEATMERLYREVAGCPGADGRRRVLHIITRLVVGGAQENTIASVQRVDPARYDSHLWCGPQTGTEGSLFEDARDRGEVPRLFPDLVREINPWRDLVVTVQLIRLLRRERFDVVHTHSSKAGIVGRVAARLAGVPHIVHTIHGWGFHEHMNPALRTTYVLLEKLMRPWTRPLVSVSNRTTSMGLEAGIGKPEDYRLIRSGIPLSRFGPDPERGAEVRAQLGIDSGDVVVGSVGRLSLQKNPMDFVRAAAGLLDRHSNVSFVYVGDGPLRDPVEAAAAELGIAGRVRFLGLRSDVPDLLRAMDVFILTSLWEGLPRVVLQALATGLPVVSYDTAGIGEAVKEGTNGHVLAPGDVEGMVELLDALVSDPALRSRMGEAARDLDFQFTEDGMISELEKLYDELTSSDRERGLGQEEDGGAV